MALLTTVVVVLRYGFATGSIALQEAVTYLHGSLFMLGVAYALKPARTCAWISSTAVLRRDSGLGQCPGGHRVPSATVRGNLAVSWGYVADAWVIRESSPEPGGIPFLYLLKTLLPLMAINLALAGIADVLRNALLLLGARTI
jgi:TRAP-type mannitol/chloroaromatic compound transport system permease small subunit